MSSDPIPPLARPWPCRTRWLTPDEVLEHLRAFCRDEMGVSDAEVGKTVVPDAPLSTLVDLASDFDWIVFGPYFGLDLDAIWWGRWRPESTVGELCEDMARRIEVPVFEPVSMLGRECLTAGAFLAIRKMLAADGADVRKLGPSAPIGPYLRRHRAVFGRVRLASNRRLPYLEPTNWVLVLGGMVVFLAALTALFTWCLGACGVAWPMSVAFAGVAALTVVLGLAVYSRRHTTPVPTDFRQLVYALLGSTPSRTTTPDPLS